MTIPLFPMCLSIGRAPVTAEVLMHADGHVEYDAAALRRVFEATAGDATMTPAQYWALSFAWVLLHLHEGRPGGGGALPEAPAAPGTPRMHRRLSAAIADIKRAARVAIEQHDLTANEMIVALSAVSSEWLPRAGGGAPTKEEPQP
jgi:hypothetical protein